MADECERPASALSSVGDMDVDIDIDDDTAPVNVQDEDIEETASESPENTIIADEVTVPKRSAGFSIDDILSDQFTPKKARAFVRPWDLPEPEPATIIHQNSGNIKNGKDGKKSKNSPLDALFKMASKTFEGLERSEVRAGNRL